MNQLIIILSIKTEEFNRTVNSEIFARVLFENKILAKSRNHSAVY